VQETAFRLDGYPTIYAHVSQSGHGRYSG